MPLDETLMARLAFIKYVFTTALKQSYAPPPNGAISLLSFHDAVELFLQLASEYTNVGSQQPSFMEYWELILKRIGKELGQKESMRRLNKARVSIKHHGTLPSQLDIESFRASTMNFFNDNCQIIFGLAFEEVSLVQLVRPESAKDRLQTAQSKISTGDTLTALDDVAIALVETIRDYDETHRGAYGQSLFLFGRKLAPQPSFHQSQRDNDHEALLRALEEQRHDIEESLDAFRGAIKIIALGLDYVKYAQFLQLTPHVSQSITGDYFIDRKNDNKNPRQWRSFSSALTMWLRRLSK